MSSVKNDRRAKDKAMAAYLKKHGVVRTTTACPHHCGAHPRVNAGMLTHLVVCRGARRKDNRAKVRG